MKKKIFLSLIIAASLLFLNSGAAQAESENQAKLLIRSHRQINITANKGFTYTVGFKNESDQTWKAGEILLKAETTGLDYYHQFWYSKEIAGKLKTDTPPGHLALIRFAITSPSEHGTSTGVFFLEDASGQEIKNSKFIVTMNVLDNNKVLGENRAPSVVRHDTEETSAPAGSGSPTYTPPAPGITPSSSTVKNYSGGDICIASLSDYCTSIPGPLGPKLRIGLFHTEETLTLINSQEATLKDGSGSLLFNVPAKQEIKVTFDFTNKNYSVETGGKKKITTQYVSLKSPSAGIWTITSYTNHPGWTTKYNDNAFSGDLEIRYASATDRLWVIEEIFMENYLKGIAETSSSSPAEYQKTMTVAARTYAMYHFTRATKHASENFHLDSHYDQVYRAYNFAQRAGDFVEPAVEATRGEIVTYNGDIIVAPYFSRSDGRTRSFEEVWGTAIPYLISVPTKYTEGETLFGHGVGIDATDAVNRAYQDGDSYIDLLTYYYTGVEVEKVY